MKRIRSTVFFHYGGSPTCFVFTGEVFDQSVYGCLILVVPAPHAVRGTCLPVSKEGQKNVVVQRYATVNKGGASSTPGSLRSKHRGRSNNPSGLAVRLADYEVDREALTNGLYSIAPAPVERGERLLKIEEMLGRVQHVLKDVPANQDAEEPNVDQKHHSGAALAGGSMSDNLWLKGRATAWKNANTRAFESSAGKCQRGVTCRGSSTKGF